jgi:hypothetical protein
LPLQPTPATSLLPVTARETILDPINIGRSMAAIAADIAEHFSTKVEPQGFKAQVVVYDKPTCVAYKAELDRLLGPDVSTVVMSRDARDPL